MESTSPSWRVTDANSCAMSFADIATSMEPSSVVATYVSHVDVLCNGDASGSIEIDVSGGIAPYAYAWTNSAGTTVSVLQDPVDGSLEPLLDVAAYEVAGKEEIASSMSSAYPPVFTQLICPSGYHELCVKSIGSQSG